MTEWFAYVRVISFVNHCEFEYTAKKICDASSFKIHDMCYEIVMFQSKIWKMSEEFTLKFCT